MFIQLIISVASLEVTGLVGAVLYRALDRALRAATGPPSPAGNREDMFLNTSFLTGTTFGKISNLLCEKSSALDKLIKSDVSCVTPLCSVVLLYHTFVKLCQT